MYDGCTMHLLLKDRTDATILFAKKVKKAGMKKERVHQQEIEYGDEKLLL